MKIIEYKLLSKIVYDQEQEFLQHIENFPEDTWDKETLSNFVSNLCTNIIDEVINNLDIVIGITTQK